MGTTAKNPPTGEWLRIGEAARFLGVSTKTLRRWDRNGTFPADWRTPQGTHRRYAWYRVVTLRDTGHVLPPLTTATTLTATTTADDNANHDITPRTTATANQHVATTPARPTNPNPHPSDATPSPEEVTAPSRVAVVYGRVSSHAQKADLQRQLEGLVQHATAEGYRVDRVFSDVGSGVNPTRRGLRMLFQHCYRYRGRITRIYITYPDRLARFSTSLLQWILQHLWGIELVCTRPDGTRGARGAEHELVEDLIAIIYSFSARLYRQRRGTT